MVEPGRVRLGGAAGRRNRGRRRLASARRASQRPLFPAQSVEPAAALFWERGAQMMRRRALRPRNIGRNRHLAPLLLAKAQATAAFSSVGGTAVISRTACGRGRLEPAATLEEEAADADRIGPSGSRIWHQSIEGTAAAAGHRLGWHCRRWKRWRPSPVTSSTSSDSSGEVAGQ